MSSAASAPNSTDRSAESFDSKVFLATLTEAPGVYRYLDAQGRVLYVGKAKNLKRRVASYFTKTGHSPRIALMLRQVMKVEVTATRSEAEALILENTLIKKLTPKYNILFRDDKSYPYIGLSGGDFPRLFYHRGSFDKHSRYFGPFPSSLAVRESIELIQKTFLLRTCEEAVFAHRSRPCLLHQIKRCKAPCVGLVSAEEYAADARLAELFLRGKHADVIDDLSQRMDAAAGRLEFEAAARLRDQIRALQTVLHRQYVSSMLDADVDIIVAVAERGGLCVNLAMVRGGLHLGDRAYFPQAPHAAEAAEILAAFIAQHYAGQPAPARLILSPWPLDELPEGLHAGPARNEMERAWLDMALHNARLAVVARQQAGKRSADRLLALQQALDLPEPPRRIECFDISHTMGEGTVASCVVCVDGAMKKSEYRRFNIEGIQPGDDYAAMRQALTRRYEKLGVDEAATTPAAPPGFSVEADVSDSPTLSRASGGRNRKVGAGDTAVPDLILIDGGKGQHAVAREVFAELGLGSMQSIGVAKGEGRKPGLETLFVHGRSQPLQLAMDNAGFHLLQEIRDEAHRFAITGHRARRAKARSRSTLEDVPGIGPARRKKLLAQFGGLAGVRAATVDDLCRIDGISRRLAEVIHGQLR
ncbi:MAG: excinuclease ABC subunit C [Betaproteobacteria bacterium HGW-Betaproteobacteria-11]|nr:MAG: excinuclease ABC subunit C [Betaproteobacteria bacterium HGW-Betaproteobacteria-11]